MNWIGPIALFFLNFAKISMGPYNLGCSYDFIFQICSHDKFFGEKSTIKIYLYYNMCSILLLYFIEKTVLLVWLFYCYTNTFEQLAKMIGS